jgi:hypothetical protein
MEDPQYQQYQQYQANKGLQWGGVTRTARIQMRSTQAAGGGRRLSAAEAMKLFLTVARQEWVERSTSLTTVHRLGYHKIEVPDGARDYQFGSSRGTLGWGTVRAKETATAITIIPRAYLVCAPGVCPGQPMT